GEPPACILTVRCPRGSRPHGSGVQTDGDGGRAAAVQAGRGQACQTEAASHRGEVRTSSDYRGRGGAGASPECRASRSRGSSQRRRPREGRGRRGQRGAAPHGAKLQTGGDGSSGAGRRSLAQPTFREGRARPKTAAHALPQQILPWNIGGDRGLPCTYAPPRRAG